MPMRTLDDLMPTVNFASRAKTQGDTDWGVRIIPDCQFLYVVSGHARLFVGQRQYLIHAGECAYFDSESPHWLFAEGLTDYFSVHFDWHQASSVPVHPAHRIQLADREALIGEPINPVLELPPYGEVTLPTLFTVSGLERILTRIVIEYELEQPGFALTLRGLLMQLLSLIFRQLLDKGARLQASSRIEPAIQAMQEHPGKNWAVSELASLCGYHPIHFAKLFKEEIGLLPKQYIIAERIKGAKRALLHGGKLETISEELGFTSIHYFSHQFKRLTGLTPTEFRMYGHSPKPFE